MSSFIWVESFITVHTELTSTCRLIIKSLCQPPLLSSLHNDGHLIFFLNQINLFIRTKRNLHSHAEKAPLTTHHNQVTGYGDVSTWICNIIIKAKWLLIINNITILSVVSATVMCYTPVMAMFWIEWHSISYNFLFMMTWMEMDIILNIAWQEWCS